MSSVVKGIAGAVAIAVGAFTGQAWLVGIGVSLEIQAFTDKKGGDTPVGGSADQISYDPTEPRKLALGRTPSRGSFVDEFSHDFLPWGGGNNGQNRVKELLLCLYDYPCDSLAEVWDGSSRKLTLGTEDSVLGFPVQEYISGGKCHLYIKFFRGAWDQAADPHLISVSGGRYTSTDQGVGNCYVRVTKAGAVDSKDQVWAGGEPDLVFIVNGARLYNPAKDTTVGGSGSHRWGQPDTYEWSDNEPLARYNVIRGFYQPNGKLFYGIGASNDEVRFDDAVAAIAIADEDVNLKGGGTERRYRIGGEISVSTPPKDTLKALADASAGRNVTVAGQYRIFVGAYNIPVREVIDTDVLPLGDYQDVPKIAADSIINAVYGTYTEPAEGYVTKSLPVRRNAGDIAEDGALGERSTNLTMPFCQSFTQGQRVQEIKRRRGRRQIRLSRVLRPIFYEIEPGDSLSLNLSRLGYVDKAFYVASIAVDSSIKVTPSLEEDDSEIYTWDPDTDELPIEGGLLPSADPPAALIPSGFVASAAMELGPNGSLIPRLRFVWEDPAEASIIGIGIEYRPVGTTNSVFVAGIDPTMSFAQLDALLLPGAQMEARAIFQSITGRDISATTWQGFAVPPNMILAPGVDPISATLQQALSPVASIRAAVAGSVYFPWLDTMEAAFAATAKASHDLMNVHGVLRDAGITRDPATGQVTISAINAVNNSFAQYQTTVSANFDAVNASISLNVTQVQFNQGIAAVAAGFTPAYRYEFNSDANGWTASNASLAASASILTYTGTGASPYLQSPTLALAAAANPLVQIKLARSTGTAWGMTIQWGAGFTKSQSVTIPTDPTQSNVVQADMTGNPDWTGTITAIRIVLGDASTVYLIDYIAIGQSALQALVVGDLTTRVTTLTSNVALLTGQVSVLATAATVDDLSGRLGTAQADIDANSASISLKAAQASLDDTNATLTVVQQTIDAQNGKIEQVLAFASGQTAVGESASPEQHGANMAKALTQFITQFAQLNTKLEYARQGLYADLGEVDAKRVQSVLELRAIYENNIAQLQDVKTTAADAVSAEASSRLSGDAGLQGQIGSGFSGVNTVAAGFVSEQSARVTGDAANANSISTVTAYFGAGINGSNTVQAVVSNEASVRAAADSTNANNITSLAAYFGSGIDASHTVAAAITNEASVRASADSANASNTTSLTTTVNGHTSTISSVQSSLNGVSAMWGMQIDVSGHVTGLLRLDGAASYSAFTVVANDFYYYDPTAGATPMFAITGGVAYFNVPLIAGLINVSTIIANNVIIKDHLVDGAATLTAHGAGGVTTNGSTQTLVSGVTLNFANAKPVTIMVDCFGSAGAGGAETDVFTVTVVTTTTGNSPVTNSYSGTLTAPTNGTASTLVNALGIPSPGATSGTVVVTVTGKQGSVRSNSMSCDVYIEQVQK